MFRKVAEIKVTHFFGDDAVELFELLEREGYIVDYAYIRLQNGECVEGKIDSWSIDKEYNRLVISMDGKKYCVHLFGCTLVYDPDLEVK